MEVIMKTVITAAVLLFSLMGVAQKKASQKNRIQLFNGKNLKGWTIKIKDHPVNENFGHTFRVENGAMKVSYDQYGGAFIPEPALPIIRLSGAWPAKPWIMMIWIVVLFPGLNNGWFDCSQIL